MAGGHRDTEILKTQTDRQTDRQTDADKQSLDLLVCGCDCITVSINSKSVRKQELWSKSSRAAKCPPLSWFLKSNKITAGILDCEICRLEEKFDVLKTILKP